jgi:6,7-dimethyl-8-ribityllumazine synthase
MARARPGKAKKETTLAGVRILVVEARFYDDIANALLEGAKRVLEQADASFDVLTVPGSLEIGPAIAIAVDAAKKARRPYDGAVALGCVIRGETLHYEIVSNESARAILDLSISLRLPIGNGILTVENDAQARARISKGLDAARVAVEMAVLLQGMNR